MLNLVNDSGLEAGLIPGWDRNGKRQFTLVIKACYDFTLTGELQLAEVQPELVSADQWQDKPGQSSLIAATETVPFKYGAEYYLYGSACPASPCAAMRVSVSLDTGSQSTHKALRVMGEHHWQSSLFGPLRGHPAPLPAATPLNYELAYGGVDAKSGKRFAENPAGRGFNPSPFGLHDPRAPLLEYDQCAPSRSPRRQSAPAGFGPIAASWAPRLKRSGPLSESPQLAEGCPWSADAAENMHNYAPDDQQLRQPFQGGETLTLQGFFPDHGRPVLLSLPVTTLSPQLLAPGQPGALSPQCDTLVINTDQRQISLLWRCALPWYSPLQPQPVTLWLPPSLLRNDCDE